MASFPPVNSVVRALDLLRALNGRPLSTIEDLHAYTKIPKPSIVRLLQTLESEGLVRHARRYGAYSLTSNVLELSSGYHSTPRLIEGSAPLLDDMTRRVKWPMAIAVPSSDCVSICYSTIPLSPLSLLHSSIGMRLSLVSRALGRAYLAFSDPDEQAALISIVKKSPSLEDRPAHNEIELRKMIDGVRKRGLATRDPRVRTVSNTLAVPIFEDARIVASLGLTFISSAMSPEEAIDRYRDDLVDLSASITARLSKLGELTKSH